MCIMKWYATVSLALLSLAMVANGQAPTADRGHMPNNQVRGQWTDPSTGLMWAGKDNGKDTNWHGARGYCHDLRLGRYSDWRLPTIDELEGIFDKGAESLGKSPRSHGQRSESMSYHVKGGLFLSGDEWSSTQRLDDRGHPNGLAWYFDFLNGRRNNEDAGRFTGFNAGVGRRALCVRDSGK
jgi:hypothetical protein